MKMAVLLAMAVLAGSAAQAQVPAQAPDASAPSFGEVIVSASRLNAPYAQQDRPVVGLRRQADSVVTLVNFSSDSRDAETRKREIHGMMLAALDRAAADGIEIVTQGFALNPVTKANYETLPLNSAGRIDTSQASVFLKLKFAGSLAAAEQRIAAFIKNLPRTGRGAIDRAGGMALTIVNPDQYRDAIVQRVADSARRYAAMFGPDYAAQISGIDGQVAWSQVSSTEVFLYLPYRYTIVPK